MAKVPISIDKVKICSSTSDIDKTRFLIRIKEKGKNWNKTFDCNIDELKKFRDELDKVVSSVSVAESLNISDEAGSHLESLFKNDPTCSDCKYIQTHNCVTCAFELQTPQERKLFLALND